VRRQLSKAQDSFTAKTEHLFKGVLAHSGSKTKEMVLFFPRARSVLSISNGKVLPRPLDNDMAEDKSNMKK